MSRIDVIIPCYKAQKFLHKALASVAIQSVVNDVKVTVVLDGEDFGPYQDIYYDFERMIDLQFLEMEKNGGPAVARQYGLDNTEGDFVTFLDADDTFAGAYSLELLRNKILENPNNVMSSGVFFEKRKEMSFVKHENDMTWLHGKMYRRSFLDEYGIRFNDTRANEDVGFNTKIKLLENENERIAFSPNLVYYWQWNDDGITRVNDMEYTYNGSYFGYVDNQIDAITFAHEKIGNDDFLLGHSIEVLANIYTYILRIRWKRPELEPKAWEYAKKYFEQVVSKLDYKNMSEEQHDEIITVAIANQIAHLHGYIIDMTFHEFMAILLA